MFCRNDEIPFKKYYGISKGSKKLRYRYKMIVPEALSADGVLEQYHDLEDRKAKMVSAIMRKVRQLRVTVGDEIPEDILPMKAKLTEIEAQMEVMKQEHYWLRPASER